MFALYLKSTHKVLLSFAENDGDITTFVHYMFHCISFTNEIQQNMYSVLLFNVKS